LTKILRHPQPFEHPTEFFPPALHTVSSNQYMAQLSLTEQANRPLSAFMPLYSRFLASFQK